MYSVRPHGIVFANPRRPMPVVKSLAKLHSQLMDDNKRDLEQLVHERRNRLYNTFKDETLLRASDDVIFELTWIMDMYSTPPSIQGRIAIRTNAIQILEEEPDLIHVIHAILKEKGIA